MAKASHYCTLLPLILALFAQSLAKHNAQTKSFIKFPIFPKGMAQRFYHQRGRYFEGDIIVRNWPVGGDLRAGSHNPRWNSGIIPYTFHPAIDVRGRTAIKSAMSDVESKTCIRFKYRDIRKPERDFVYITPFKLGCFSYVGRNGGSQQLNLGPGCWHKTTILHQLVHAIGFWHEHSRLDRDNYVNIHWNNIPRNYWRDFAKHSKLNDFGTPYDYRSVMHFSSNAFAWNWRRATISTKQAYPLGLLGSGDDFGGLTQTDALQINKMYNCDNGKS